MRFYLALVTPMLIVAFVLAMAAYDAVRERPNPWMALYHGQLDEPDPWAGPGINVSHYGHESTAP